jgi:AcrR family transcriptional regulator
MAKSFRRRSPRSYHHGNLASTLVEAALALLDEKQDWDFSLREVARRAGVSHNAPYKHFPEKRDLLAAVAARGFEALAEHMLSSLNGLTDARARLLACGQAFVARGVTNPALYRLMFSAARRLRRRRPPRRGRSSTPHLPKLHGREHFLQAWQIRAKARQHLWQCGPYCTVSLCSRLTISSGHPKKSRLWSARS